MNATTFRVMTVLTAALAISCTSTYRLTALSDPGNALEPGRSVAIASPTNGSYGGKEYAGSSQSTAIAVRAAFARHAREVTIVNGCDRLDCLMEQAGRDADYLVVPEILQWEDRATEWSGIKDKLEIKLSIYDAKTGNQLGASTLAGNSKWLTFGGDHPQDLLPELIGRYVESLF